MQNGRSLGIQIKIDCSHLVLAAFIYFRSHPDPILSIFNTQIMKIKLRSVWFVIQEKRSVHSIS